MILCDTDGPTLDVRDGLDGLLGLPIVFDLLIKLFYSIVLK